MYLADSFMGIPEAETTATHTPNAQDVKASTLSVLNDNSVERVQRDATLMDLDNEQQVRALILPLNPSRSLVRLFFRDPMLKNRESSNGAPQRGVALDSRSPCGAVA